MAKNSSGVRLAPKDAEPKEVARFEVVVFSDGCIYLNEDQMENLGLENIQMYTRQFLYYLDRDALSLSLHSLHSLQSEELE